MKVSAPEAQYISAPLGAKTNTRHLPASYIDGSLLKAFEQSASSRGLLGTVRTGDFYPLWFHFENERNIQLWKQGLSLADAEQCRVWVEPLELINKILRKSGDNQNPLLSPGYFSADPGSADQGEANRYFQTLATLLERALPHLHALSYVGAEVVESQNQLIEIVVRLGD